MGANTAELFYARATRPCPVERGARVVECGETFRLFNCRRCHCQVRVGSDCDRGHLYCLTCAPLGRAEARRRASARYQRTPRGARRHAARQRDYRSRRTGQKVTDKGCQSGAAVFTVAATFNATVSCDDLRVSAQPIEAPRSVVCAEMGRCHFCQRPLPRFARLHTYRGWGFG